MTNFDNLMFRNKRNGSIVYVGVPPQSLDDWEQVYVTTTPPSEDPSAPSVALRAVLDLLDRADAKPGPEGERKVNTAAVRAAIDSHCREAAQTEATSSPDNRSPYERAWDAAELALTDLCDSHERRGPCKCPDDTQMEVMVRAIVEELMPKPHLFPIRPEPKNVYELVQVYVEDDREYRETYNAPFMVNLSVIVRQLNDVLPVSPDRTPAGFQVVSSEDHVDADTIPKEGTKQGSTNVPPPHANKER